MDLEYRIDGPVSAPVLVLSNSLGTTWTLWDAQFSSFIKRFRVLRYNTRGHGNSPLPAREMNLALLGQDVVDLLDHLNIPCASFCGVSLGGLTGLWLNLRYPQRFSQFVLANTALRIGNQEAWLTRARRVRAEGLSPVVATSAQRWFTEDYIRHKPGVVANMLEGLATLSPTGYAACCEVLARADLRADAADISRPVLMIAGQEDPVTTIADAQQVVDTVADAALCVLPASHLANIACAREFTRQTLNFLLRGETHGAHH
ncbi:alpha/beta fold hydrolase [Martelella alba]|nr:alpha/beta fold hydrolase [Martelella alba]